MFSKFRLGAVAAVLVASATSATAQAQQPSDQASKPAAPVRQVPTKANKILVIGNIVPGTDISTAEGVLPKEIRDTVELYLDGKIDQWYSTPGRTSVVFILNMTDPAAAREMLEKLPLSQAHYITWDLIPLGPLAPLRMLQGMATGSP